MKTQITLISLYYLVWVIAGRSFNPFEWEDWVRVVFAACSVFAMLLYCIMKFAREEKRGQP